MKVSIGSKNPAKVKAVEALLKNFNGEVIPFSTKSGVSSQPFSDEETKEGAINRAKACVVESDCELGFGLEGGVIDNGDEMYLCNWGALATKGGNLFVASGAKFPLPAFIANEVRKGRELGDVMGEFTKNIDVRKKEGAIGIFSAGYVSRDEMFTHIVKLLVGQYVYHQNN